MVLKKLHMPWKSLENPLGNFSTAQRKNEKCVKKEERNRKEKKKAADTTSRQNFDSI